MDQRALISLPTNELLDKFGSGGHKPGSGSAAALMGILSAKLIVTVCKLSASKPKYKNIKNQLEFVIEQVETDLEPRLQEHFQRDSEIFDHVIKCRQARDRARSEGKKREHRKAELEHLREATEIPIDISTLCMSLIDNAIFIFDRGFTSARGDSGAAIASAIAGVTSGVFVANLNLKSFGASKWKAGIEEQCDSLLITLEDKQSEAFSKIVKLSEEEPNIRSFDFDN